MVRKAEGSACSLSKLNSTCASFINMTTRTERFQRKPRQSQDRKDEAGLEHDEVIRFSPEEGFAKLEE